MIVSICLGGGFIYLAFDDLDHRVFLGSIKAIKWDGIAIYCLLFILSHGLRILRWGQLIRASHHVPWPSLFSIGAQGYALITLLPFRMGELSRPLLLQKKHDIPFSTTLGTLLVERITDGLMCLGFFGLSLALFVPQNDPNPSPNAQKALLFIQAGAWSLGLLFICILSGIILLLWKPYVWKRAIQSTIGSFFPDLSASILKMSDDLHQGLHFNVSQWIYFMVLTGVYWIIQGGIFPLMAYATGIDPLSLSQSFILLSVVVIGIMIPAGPGFTGSFELAVKGGFLILMIPDHPHIPLFIAALHLSQFTSQVGLGCASWIWIGHKD